MIRIKILEFLDTQLFTFLDRNYESLPIRIAKFCAFYYPDARIRKKCLLRLGCKIGENTYTNFGFTFVYNKITVEPRVLIGKNVSIGPNVTIVVDSSANNGQEINKIPYVRDKLTVDGTIVIEDEVWIGASVTILPNVRVGHCSIVGAGSLVLKDVPPYSIVAGVPAKHIRDLK